MTGGRGHPRPAYSRPQLAWEATVNEVVEDVPAEAEGDEGPQRGPDKHGQGPREDAPAKPKGGSKCGPGP